MRRLRTFVLLLLLSSPAVADTKSLLIGISIGLGVYTVQQGVIPVSKHVAAATKKASKVTAKGVRRAVKGPK